MRQRRGLGGPQDATERDGPAPLHTAHGAPRRYRGHIWAPKTLQLRYAKVLAERRAEKLRADPPRWPRSRASAVAALVALVLVGTFFFRACTSGEPPPPSVEHRPGSAEVTPAMVAPTPAARLR